MSRLVHIFLMLLALVLAVSVNMMISAEKPAAVEHDERHHADPRSPKWPAVRDAYIKAHPTCAACGSTGKPGKPLQAHHVISFHEDANGDADGDGIPNELDPDNLITLCVDGPCNTHCHFVFGHSGDTKLTNPQVREDAARFKVMLTQVWAYDGPDCEPCRKAKKELQAAGDKLPFRVVWQTDKRFAAIEDRPLFVWSTTSGNPAVGQSKTSIGWHGLEKLRTEWTQSRK